MDWKFLVYECVSNIGTTLEIFFAVFPVSCFCIDLTHLKVVGSLKTHLLFIGGDLAGGGYLAVVVGLRYRLNFFLKILGLFMVSVLLTLHAKRFSVSRIFLYFLRYSE